jgi:hypothetical protein
MIFSMKKTYGQISMITRRKMVYTKEKLIRDYLETLKDYYLDHREEQEVSFDTWLFLIDRNFINEIIWGEE